MLSVVEASGIKHMGVSLLADTRTKRFTPAFAAAATAASLVAPFPCSSSAEPMLPMADITSNGQCNTQVLHMQCSLASAGFAQSRPQLNLKSKTVNLQFKAPQRQPRSKPRLHITHVEATWRHLAVFTLVAFASRTSFGVRDTNIIQGLQPNMTTGTPTSSHEEQTGTSSKRKRV